MLRAAYLDLDGTLLGRGASLFRDADGAFTLLGARALEACARADVEVVPYSGRRQSTLLHDSRMLGLPSYIFEAGCGLVLDGELEWLTDGLEPREGKTIHEQIEESGAPALLLEPYAGRLRVYEPWRYNREVSHLFLGDEIDAFEADALLTEHGCGHLRLVDNGAMHGIDGNGRAYHLIPRAASKARAVAVVEQRRAAAQQGPVQVEVGGAQHGSSLSSPNGRRQRYRAVGRDARGRADRRAAGHAERGQRPPRA